MSRVHRLLARRLIWMVLSAWIVLSLTFFLFIGSPDPNISLVRFAAAAGAAVGGGGDPAAAEQAAVQAYVQQHNYNVPILERYLNWMANYATFQWGETLRGEPVTQVVKDALVVTFTYLLPALLVATVGSFSLGLYIATNRGGYADRLVSALAYAGYGVPIFFAGEIVFGILVQKYGQVWLVFNQKEALYTMTNIDQFLLPGLIMAVHVLIVQMVFIRSEVIEQLNEDFMKTLLASGAGRRDLARHALRNAAIPLTSAFFAEILTLLYLSVIVIEVVFNLPGFGQTTLQAIRGQDIGLILGVTIVPLLLGIIGNTVQDLAYSLLDPRIEIGD